MTRIYNVCYKVCLKCLYYLPRCSPVYKKNSNINNIYKLTYNL